MSKKRKLTPYQRIVRAAKAGRGCLLSADDCFQLGVMDDAITTVAQRDDERDKPEPESQPNKSASTTVIYFPPEGGKS